MIVAELVDGCNLRCELCWNRERDMTYKQMSLEVVDRILALYGDQPIDWYNWGEPLMYRDLPELAKRVAGKKARISTNLSLPIKDETIGLLQSFDRVFVSISGTTDLTYGKYHHGGNLGLVVENLRRLAKAKRSGVVVRWIDHPGNRHERPDMEKLCRSLDIGLSIVGLNCLIEESLEGFKHPMIEADRPGRSGRCKMLDWTVIGTDGDYLLCCATRNLPLGYSVFDDVSHEVLRQQKLRHGLCCRCRQEEVWKRLA